MATLLEITDFTGGLNTEQSPLALTNNEATIFENWVVGAFGVRRRKGFRLETSLTENIVGAYKFSDTEWIFVTDSWAVKRYDEVSKSVTDLGTISGSVTPKFAYFDPYVCIATGSLYLVDVNTNTIANPTTLPAVDVLVKDGRLWIGGGDEIWASRVGDPTDWTNVGGDDASAQYVQIGYKDGGEILGFTNLFDDILVFKDTGTYRLQGSFPAVSVSLITRKRTALSNTSYVSLSGDMVAYDNQGAYMVSSSFRYGDLVFDDIDIKVKSELRERFGGRIFYSPTLRALIFKLTNGFMLYFYQTKTWVVWRTGLGIEILADKGDGLWGFSNKIFRYEGDYDTYSPLINDAQTTEISNAGDPINDTTQIEAVFRSKRVANTYPLVLQRVGVVFTKNRPELQDVITLTLGKAAFSITLSKTSPNIYDSREEIASNQKTIWQGISRDVIHKHQLQRVSDFYVYIKTADPVVFNGVIVEGGVRDG